MSKKFILILIVPFLAFSCGQQEKEKVETYSIDQFMDNTSVFGSSFSPDEEKILFTSNESGVYNAYENEIEAYGKILSFLNTHLKKSSSSN